MWRCESCVLGGIVVTPLTHAFRPDWEPNDKKAWLKQFLDEKYNTMM